MPLFQQTRVKPSCMAAPPNALQENARRFFEVSLEQYPISHQHKAPRVRYCVRSSLLWLLLLLLLLWLLRETTTGKTVGGMLANIRISAVSPSHKLDLQIIELRRSPHFLGAVLHLFVLPALTTLTTGTRDGCRSIWN